MQYENDANATTGTGTTGSDRETGLGGSGIGSGSSTTTGRAGSTGTADGMGTGGGTTGRAEEMKAKARERADELAHKAADRLEGTVDRQKVRARSQLTDLSQSLRVASDQLPADNGISRYMGMAATQVDNLASFLDNTDVADLVDDVESFARRQPALFLGGAFAVGVLGARFLKSSRRDTMTGGRMWDEDDPTYRVRETERDSISRPGAPGYAAPPERGDGRIREPDTF